MNAAFQDRVVFPVNRRADQHTGKAPYALFHIIRS
jgi:hypothetical protein